MNEIKYSGYEKLIATMASVVISCKTIKEINKTSEFYEIYSFL